MTANERNDWYQMALTVIGARCTENTLTVQGHNLPEVCWRYEATLQAKDALLARWQEAEQELRLDIRDKDAQIETSKEALGGIAREDNPETVTPDQVPKQGPLDVFERLIWEVNARDIIKHPERYAETCAGYTKCLGALGMAHNRLRCLETIKAKDAQIAALVTALESAPLGLERWARTNANYECWFSVYAAWRQKREAVIKEATNG